jgi:hypothetical protein
LKRQFHSVHKSCGVQVYKTAEFISRVIPTHSHVSDINRDYIKTVVSFLEKIDILQDINPLLTIRIHAADGLWLHFKGMPQALLKPTQNYLLLHVFERNALSDNIDHQVRLFKKSIKRKYAYRLWQIQNSELEWLLGYIERKWKPLSTLHTNGISEKHHPRNFPGYVRQAALDEFEKEGRWCPGTKNFKRHRVPKNVPIEFDHILPHVKGGGISYNNCQVLCESCNRIKLASAL